MLKFNFPNQHAVYMHDTLQPELFNQTERTLSHGCIRVRQPDRSAALLLAKDKGWPEEQVKSLLAKGESSVVPLAQPVPVYLDLFHHGLRWQSARLQTFADIYGLDTKMAAVLFGKTELRAVEPGATDAEAKRMERRGLRFHIRPVRELGSGLRLGPEFRRETCFSRPAWRKHRNGR